MDWGSKDTKFPEDISSWKKIYSRFELLLILIPAIKLMATITKSYQRIIILVAVMLIQECKAQLGCGDETINGYKPGKIMTTFNGPDIIIPYSVYSNWFSVSLNDAPPECSTKTYCAVSCTSPQTFFRLSSGLVIKNSVFFTTKTSRSAGEEYYLQPFIGKTPSGKQASFNMEIRSRNSVVCGSETIGMVQPVAKGQFYYSYIKEKADVNAASTFKTLTSSSSKDPIKAFVQGSNSNDCPINEVVLYQDDGNGGYVEFTDTTKVRISASNQLEINVKDAIFGPIKIYLVGKTSSGRTGISHPDTVQAGIIEIDFSVICGLEIVEAVQAEETLLLLKKTGTRTISASDIASYFSISNHHNDCKDLTYSVCTSKSSSSYCDSSLLVDNTQLIYFDGTNMIINTGETQTSTIVHIRAKSIGSKVAYKTYTISVSCGQETVGLSGSPAATENVSKLPDTSGTTYQDIATSTDLLQLFVSSSDLCPVTQVVIYYDDSQGNKVAWTDTSKIRISNNNLQVNVKDAIFGPQKVYVAGKTANGRDGILNPSPSGDGIKSYEISVQCGQETVGLSGSYANPIVIEENFEPTLGPYKVIDSTLLQKFTSSSGLCPVTSVKLYKDDGSGNKVLWQDTSKIRLTSNQLEANIKDALFVPQTVYAIGQTDSGRNALTNPSPSGAGIVQYKISVSCRETIASSSGTQSFQLQKISQILEIPSSDMQNYFTVQSPSSNPLCLVLSFDACLDNTNCDGSRLASNNLPQYMDGQTFKINQAIDQSSSTVYIQGITAGGKIAFKQLSITVECGMETVSFSGQPVSIVTIEKQLNLDSNDQFEIVQTQYLNQFTTTSDLCPVTQLVLYQEKNGQYSQYLESQKFKISNNKIEINIKDAYFSENDYPPVYIVGLTAKGRSSLEHFTYQRSIVQTKITVTACGRERLSLAPNTIDSFKFLKKTEIEKIELYQYFEMSLNGSHQKCRQLKFKAYDQNSNWLDSIEKSAYVEESDSTLRISRAFDKINEKISIQALTQGFQKLEKFLEFNIECGTETIGVNQQTVNQKISSQKIILNLNQNAANSYKTLTEGYDLIGAFSDASSSDLCPIKSIDLYTENRKKWKDFNKIRLSARNELEINVKLEPFSKETIVAVGRTESGRTGILNPSDGKVGYITLSVQVDAPPGFIKRLDYANFPPIFNDPLPDELEIEVGENNTYIYKSPLMIDAENDPITVRIFNYNESKCQCIDIVTNDTYFELIIDTQKIIEPETIEISVQLSDDFSSSQSPIFSIKLSIKIKESISAIRRQRYYQQAFSSQQEYEVKQNWIKCDYSDIQCLQEEVNFIRNQYRDNNEAITNLDQSKLRFIKEILLGQKNVDVFKQIEESEDDKKSTTKILASWITQINQIGEMTIKFNSTLDNRFIPEKDKFDDSVLDISFKTAQTDVDIANYNFTWYLVEFESKQSQFLIQLEFDEPFSISAIGKNLDQISVKFRQPWMFVTKDKGQFIDEQFLEIKANIGRQMPLDRESTEMLIEQTKMVRDTLQSTTIIVFLGQLILKGVLKKFLGAITLIQLIIFMAILNIPYPGNVVYFFSELKPIISFDILSYLGKLNEIIFDFDIANQKRQLLRMMRPLKEIGTKYTNIILNLGFFGQIISLILLEALIIMPILAQVTRKFKFGKIQKKIDTQIKQLYFGRLIAIMTRAYMPICVSIYVALSSPIYTTSGEKLGNIFAYILTFLAILVPILCIIVIIVPKETLNHPKFKQMLGSIYSNNRIESRYQRSYSLLYLARRASLIFIGIFLHNFPCQQIQILILVYVLMIIYASYHNVFKTRQLNSINNYNELFILCSCYCMLFFSDWVHQSDLQYDYGFTFIYLLVFMLGFNSYFVLVSILKNMKLNMIKQYKILKKVLQNKQIRTEQSQIKQKSMLNQIDIKVPKIQDGRDCENEDQVPINSKSSNLSVQKRLSIKNSQKIILKQHKKKKVTFDFTQEKNHEIEAEKRKSKEKIDAKKKGQTAKRQKQPKKIQSYSHPKQKKEDMTSTKQIFSSQSNKKITMFNLMIGLEAIIEEIEIDDDGANKPPIEEKLDQLENFDKLLEDIIKDELENEVLESKENKELKQDMMPIDQVEKAINSLDQEDSSRQKEAEVVVESFIDDLLDLGSDEDLALVEDYLQSQQQS